MRKLITILFVLLSAVSFGQLSDGSVTGNQTVIRINYGGLNTQALLWLPDDYNSEGNEEKEYPLIIFLHGSGEGTSNNITQVTNQGLPYLIKNGLKPYGIYPNSDTGKFIVVSPHAANTSWSYNIGHLKLALPWIKTNYRVKETQVYVTGLSAGGAGAWSCPSEDTTWVRQNIAGIAPLSAVEYTLGDMTNNRTRIKQAHRDGLGIIQVCGALDAWNVAAARYDTTIQNAPPVDGKYYYKTIAGADHGADAWNPPYTLEFTEFDGKNLYDKFLEWSRGDEEEEPEEPTGCGGVRRTITASGGVGRYINGLSYTYNPGDTLVLTGTWTAGLEIDNFHGTAECPLVMINEDSVNLPGGLNFEHCTYLKVTGSGSDHEYGINIIGTGGGPGITITGRSANIEVERVSVYDKLYGITCKQEVGCADSLLYPNWYMDSISVHDCIFKLIGQDGLYFGSTNPNGGDRCASCNGELINCDSVPIRLSNIKIYNNLVDTCSRTGIQLSGGDAGVNEIYNNVVKHCGYEFNQTQGDGIALGGASQAHIHHNYIRQTFKHGIYLIGSKTSIIEHNDIDSSGILGDTTNSFAQPTNIYADSRATTRPVDDSVQLIIRNNVVGANAVADGKQIILNNTNGTFFSSGTIVCGNKNQGDNAPADIYVAGTINYSTDCGEEPDPDPEPTPVIRIKKHGKLRFTPPES